VRHIPKPSHPTFPGTLFAEHLKAIRSGIRIVVELSRSKKRLDGSLILRYVTSYHEFPVAPAKMFHPDTS
jgi:hypothetical protein